MNAVFEKLEYFRLSSRRFHGIRGYPPMFHPHGELDYVIRGSLSITVDGQPYRLGSGDLAVLFPYQIHSYEKAPDAEVLVLMFDPAVTAFDNTLLSRQPVCCNTEAQALYPLLDRAVTMLQAGKDKTATAYLNAVLGEALDMLSLQTRDTAHKNVTLQVLSWCAEHFPEDITEESIAKALYVSQSYISRIFTQKLRCSFREYINTLRVHKAQELLKNTDLKIVQIMAQCGFRNQSSFNRIFLDLTGMPPRQFRNHHQQETHL